MKVISIFFTHIFVSFSPERGIWERQKNRCSTDYPTFLCLLPESVYMPGPHTQMKRSEWYGKMLEAERASSRGQVKVTKHSGIFLALSLYAFARTEPRLGKLRGVTVAGFYPESSPAIWY
jgi:hypothetical protein